MPYYSYNKGIMGERQGRYSAGGILGVSFGLYGMEDINYDETISSMLDYIAKRQMEINQRLRKIGLKLIDFASFAPMRYNYENDDLTLVIVLIDPDLYISYLESKRTEIQALLDSNKSYSGYISLTVKSVDEEINNIRKGKLPDILPITYTMHGFMTQEEVERTYVFEEV